MTVQPAKDAALKRFGQAAAAVGDFAARACATWAHRCSGESFPEKQLSGKSG